MSVHHDLYAPTSDTLTLDSASDVLTPHSVRAGESLTLDSVPDTLTLYSDPSNTSSPGSDSLTPDSVPDTLTLHSEPVVAGLDWERDGWRVSIAGAPAVKVSRDDMLTTNLLDAADIVVVEQAHMRPRTVYSVAQVYTEDELRTLPFRSKIRLFPGMPGQLARAARAVGNVSNKVNEYGQPLPDKDKDAETMAMFAAASPERVASWKRLKLPEEDPARKLWPARDQLRDDLREALNPLRTAWNAKSTAEKYALPEVARFCALLDSTFDDLSDGVKEQFGIRRSRNGIRVERMPAALTVYLAVYTREGDLRLRPDGQFIGVRFILDSIGMSSSYRPNMARSQLTYHGMRHYKGGRDGGARSEYMRNLRHFIQILRDSDSLTADSVPDTLTVHSEQGRSR